MKKTITVLVLAVATTAMGLGIKHIERVSTQEKAFRFVGNGDFTPNPKYELAGKTTGIGWYKNSVLGVTALTSEWIIMARHTRPTTRRPVVRFADENGEVTEREVDLSTVVFPPQMSWQVPMRDLISVQSRAPDIALAKLKQPLPSSIKPMRIGAPPKVRDRIHVYGFLKYGGLNYGSWTNTIWRVQAGQFSIGNDIMGGDGVTIVGDSGSPTLNDEGDIIGVHFSRGADVDITDPQIREWIESVAGRQEEPGSDVNLKDIVVEVKPGQTVIVRGVE